MTETRSSLSTIALVVVTLVLLGALFWVQYETLMSRSPLADRQLELLEIDRKTDFPSMIVDRTKSRLSKAPNDQASLNLLFVGLARSGAGDAERREMASLLSKLGWRSNSAQQNLIVEAARTRNFEAIVKSSDALLRRGQSEEQILQLLHLVELEPEVQTILVEQLSHNPDWKKDFLTRTEYLQTGEQISARAQTLNLILDKGQDIERSDLAPSLNVMVNAGQFEAALKIFRKFGENLGSAIVADPDFVMLAKSRNIQGYRPFPFEWANHQKRGLQITAYNSIGSGEVKIRWDGRGTPLVLSQYVKVGIGQNYRLALTGLDATPDLLRRLQFSLFCKSSFVRFDQIIENRKSSQLLLATNSTPACEFPRLDIRGKVQDVNRPHEISLSSINIMKIQKAK
jgi:hypothetical protein